MKDDITNYAKLKAALASSFDKFANFENAYATSQRRWVVQDSLEKNIAIVQISLMDERGLGNDDSVEIAGIKLFGEDFFDRFKFSGFPYNHIPKYKDIASAQISLLPVSKQWNGSADKGTKYGLKIDENATAIRFGKEMAGRYIFRAGRGGYTYSSLDLTSSINAVLAAQRIMKGIEGALQVDIDEICDEILKKGQ